MSMMNPKPFASLSSGLLARKGQAKPAMRPQGFLGMSPVPSDDLGWNDMGHELPPMEPVAPPVQAQVPPVLRQRELLDERFAPLAPPEQETHDAEPVVAPVAPATDVAEPTPVAEPADIAPPVAVRPVSDGTLKRIGRQAKAKKGAKAAFTLRLDADRHLRLRLASAVTNRSAQLLVTDALDAYLADLAELDALVERVPGRRG